MSRRLTDEEIAERYSQQYRVETPGAGVGALFSSGASTAAAAALELPEAFGLSRDYRLAQEAEAQRTSQRYYDTNQDAVGSFRNISGVGDVGRYALELGAQSLPSMLPIIGAGLIGGPAAAYGVAGLTGIGAVAQAQREQTGRTDLTAVPLGLAYGGVEAATGIVGKLAGTGVRAERAASAANRYLDNLGGFTGGAARTGAAFGRTGFSEAIGEVGQEYIANVGRLAIDPRVELFSPEAMDDYAESFVGGGLLGGLVGGAAGGWRRSQGFRDAARERDLTSTEQDQTPLVQRPLESQFVTQDQTVGLQSFINQNVGVTRPKRKDYVSQFKAAYDEPTGQFVNDPETGIERPLTVGEALQRSQTALDLTQEKPADAAATAQVVASTVRDPRSYELRDTFNVTPTPSSLQFYSEITADAQATGVPLDSDLFIDVWKFASDKPMTPKRLEKARELLDSAIIKARQEAPIGTGVSTVQQPAGGLGVGSPVVQGAVGNAGPATPVAGAVVGGAPVAGAPLQQTGILPVASGQPSTTVTTTAPAAAPAPDTRFRRAPRPMTVLEAANAAKAAQAQQAETQGQATPAAAGPVVDPRQATLQQIFGQRNGDIIFDVVGMGMPEPEAATKYGLSRQAIQKIAGATGQKTWPERIARAKTEFGLTDAKIAEAFNVAPQEELGTEVERDVFGRGEAAGAITEAEAIEGGLENIVKTAGAGTAEVEGFTKLDNDVMTVLERVASLRDAVSKAKSETELAELKTKLQVAQDNLAGLTEKAKAVGKRKQAEVRRDAGKVTAEGETDAVQVESPAGVSVQPEAKAGKGVGGQVRRAKKPAAEGKAQVPAVILTEAEQAAQAWDVVAADYPQAPKFAELTKTQQQDFIEFGPGNWERGDVELELTKLARGGMKFGKEGDIKPAKAKNPYTAKELLAELKDFIRADIPGRKLLVVDSIEDLLRSPDKMVRAVGAGIALEGAYGVAVNGRAYLIANRIQKGAGRAKFMHEVGAHLGLEKLLPKAQYDKLTQQILTWARKDDGSIESELALNAVERVQAAGTKQEDRRSEMLAYFIEEAMEAGIDPTAGSKNSAALTSWFRTLWAAFKTAVRRLGMKPESMNAQDVVNLAFGAARLEINGTWHGTAADFRKFSNEFMGTGEGAQAYGWGTYLAQRTGIAKGYWSADVDRKSGFVPAQALYDGVTIGRSSQEINAATVPVAMRMTNYGLSATDAIQAEIKASERIIALRENSVKSAEENNLPGLKAMKDTLQTMREDLAMVKSLDPAKFKVTPKTKVGPEGTLMRVDTAITPEETLDWDRPLSEQPAILEKLGMLMPEGLQEALADQYQQNVEDIGDLTGEDLYRGLRFLEKNEGAVSEFWGIDDYVGQPGKKVASLFLDSMGIKGIQFLDAKSRGASGNVEVDGKSLWGTINGDAWAALVDSKGDIDAAIAELKKQESGFNPVYADNATEGIQQLEALRGQDVQYKAKVRTRNLVVFDDKNIFRVGSEVAADPQRMKFGSDMVELGKRGQLKEKAGKTRVDTANDRAIKLLDKADKTKDPAEAAALRAEANALFSATAGKLTGMKFGKNMPSQGLIDRNIAKLPKMSQQPVKRVTQAIGDLGGAGLDYVVFTSDLVKRAQALGLGAAKTFSDRLAARNAKVSEEERKIEKIADGYASIEDENKGSGPDSVNDFLFESTRTGKWGYGKYRDAKMGAAFDKLKPKAQQFVKDVFAHGDATLSNKKKIVLEATNSEYDAMIKVAQDLVNTTTDEKDLKKAKENLAAVKAEKAATLKRFQTLFRIREGMPYAPIKRTGNYVVIGKSAEYIAAEDRGDTATTKKLESDPDHYHVSFVDTKWQARNLKDNLAEQGVFPDPQFAKRAESFDEMFSGEAALPAVTKLRNAVDARATTPSGAKDPTAGKLLNIISQLYLEALAEGSARKSEMRRRGVAGEVDMLQSFTQQGRADANFLASVEFEPKIQEALQQMRNQSRTGDRDRKSEIFDELTKRYAGTLDPKPSPFISGITNLASKFFLASSPAYYLQNLTQPFMMSLPAMAGRHDYTKAAAELTKAYAELGPLFKDVKLIDEQFDFSKVPADVRTAINDLVNQGKIDIGLATEINEYKVEADNKLSKFAQRLNKGMRMAVQKVEATNRLSTAIAAYRLEFERAKKDPKIADPKAAATQYAADILTDTHGDYTAFNAPRAFNTQWGKVALQFRKFQLIQIAFYAKLFRDLGRTPEERAVAMKTLAYSLSHTGVFAGLMGMPGYAAISFVLGLFGDEDEPYDLTADMRKAIGPEWADMIMRGAPTIVGMDLSGKIGAGNMLSILPFSNADLSTTSGQVEAFGAALGGASLGMATRVADGLILMSKGDYYKGLERVMPKGVSDALKSGRQATEGMTRRNGDVVLPESEIGAIETVLTGLGIPSVQQSVTYERQNRMRDITENFQDRTTRIKNDYAKAVRQKDTAAMQGAREAWTKLQQARQRNGLKPQPMSNLLKAPQEQKAREQRTVGGVAYREGQRKLAESVAEN